MSSNSRTGIDITDLFTCSVCKACKFGTAEELCNHERICDGLYKEIFTCDTCHKEFGSFDEAVQHEKQCGDNNIVNKPNKIHNTVYITSSGDEHEISETEKENSTYPQQQDENGFLKEVFTCDVCNTAQFDTMEEAIEHENQCRELYTCGACNITQFGAMEEAIEHENQCRITMKKTNKSKSNEIVPADQNAISCTVKDRTTRIEDNENNFSNELLKEEFTCNVCKIAQFDTMEEAIKHENQCSSIKPKNLRKEALNASGDQYATSCAMVEQGSISVGMKEVFTCDVCNTAQFDTMEEAIEHENKCIIIQKNDPHNSRSSISGNENSTLERQRKRPSVLAQNGNDHAEDTNILKQSTQWEQPYKCVTENEDTIRVVIPPGRIGLLLKLDKQFGGALITKVEENSTTGGAVEVGDRIVSIDNHKIVRVADYSINHDKTRTLEVAVSRARGNKQISLKHVLFAPCSSMCNEKSLIEHSSVAFPQSSMVKSNARQTYGCKGKGKQSFLNNYLRPVGIPFNPLDEYVDNSLERELAWLIEESTIISPQLAQNPMAQLFILDYAWRHSSLALRTVIDKTFPRVTGSVMKSIKVDLSDQEIRDKYCNQFSFTLLDANLLKMLDKEKLRHHRGDVRRVVSNFGFRRSPSIERELDLILSQRIDHPVYLNVVARSRQRTRRRKRLHNDNVIMTADEVNLSLPSTVITNDEVNSVVADIPSALSSLEDEVAFLVEESLILLPDHMLKTSADKSIITSVVSAGLSTQHDDDINWNFVCKNASEELKKVIEKVGIKRRPLRRIIRYHCHDVRIAFERRRVKICELLVLHGYRRKQTCMNLPSKELLDQVGLLNVMKVRLKYRLRTMSPEHATKRDLRSACNIKSKKQRAGSKRKRSVLDFTKVRRYSVLSAAERELAFLREEFEADYNHGCFDWDYIEKRSSQELRQIMVEMKVVPVREHPAVIGVSKLKKLVRLDTVEVNRAFTELRQDIRYALNVGYKRAKKCLPDLPPAPASKKSSRGEYVLDVESPTTDQDQDGHLCCHLFAGDERILSPDILLRGEWSGMKVKIG